MYAHRFVIALFVFALLTSPITSAATTDPLGALWETWTKSHPSTLEATLHEALQQRSTAVATPIESIVSTARPIFVEPTNIPTVTPPSQIIPPAKTTRPTAEYVIVTSPFLRLRDAPNRNGKLIRELDHGEELKVLVHVDSRWLHIETADKITGYVAGENTAAIAPKSIMTRYLPTIIIHHVGTVPIGYEKSAGLYVATDTLELLAQTIVARGYTTVRLADLAHPDTLPDRAVALTFDDGYADFAENALPILQKYNLTATLYVITNRLDQPGYLTTEHIKTIAATGIEIGSHTVSHPDLAILSNAHIERELVDSKATLEKIIGRSVATLCYPSGDYDGAVMKAVKKAGYALARTTESGLTVNLKKPYELPGVRLFSSTKKEAIERWLR